MSDFTPEQLDKLAVFCGYRKRRQYVIDSDYVKKHPVQLDTHYGLEDQDFWFEGEKEIMRCSDWRPDSNPAHWWLVLKVWAEKDNYGWDGVLICLCRINMACDDKDKTFDIMDETCRAVLAIKGDRYGHS